MPAGRPREVAFTPDEMIELGKEMIEWVKQNDPLHLSQWYTIEKDFTYNELKVFITCKEFFPYYEKALKLVGIKYLDGESKRVKEGISQRWQRVYFKDLKEEEDDTLRFKAQLDKEVSNAIPDSVLEGQRAILDQLKGMKPKVTPIDSIDV